MVDPKLEFPAEEKDGYKIYRKGSVTGRIIRITKGVATFRIGQRVTATGRFLVPEGTYGIVTSLILPGTEGYTSNVVGVWFEGLGKANFMKFEDLELESYTV